MNSSIVIAKRIVAACVVATGFAVLWAVGTRWMGILVHRQVGVFEAVQVAQDGTPVIETYVSGTPALC